MLILNFTKNICREIVHRGTDSELDHHIQRRRISRTLFAELSGHLVGTVKTAITPGDSGNVSVDSDTYHCSAPLLSKGKLDIGTKVIFQQNMQSGDWEIIAAECPEE